MIWKKIWTNEKYSASNIGGLIRNDETGKILKQRLKRRPRQEQYQGNSKKYFYVKLSPNKHEKREYLVHRCVAMAHKKKYKETHVVNHKDRNRQNNDATNVHWVTPEYNMKHWRKQESKKAIKEFYGQTTDQDYLKEVVIPNTPLPF
jgi:hypothetical protein